ncbi:MAG: hypothetical protein KF816_13905 [Melioribacteraceae bacterium]|jgi:hypothetical protein|nr:hypothetical protein [Melioribacteraceae bacterium]
MKNIDDLMNDFIDNQLDNNEIEQLNRAIDNDVELKTKLKALKVVDSTMRKIEVDPVNESFTSKVMVKINKAMSVYKPVKNYFFYSMISIMSILLTSILIAMGYYSSGNISESPKMELFEKITPYITSFFSSAGSLLANKFLMTLSSSMILLLLVVLFLSYDGFKNFKNRLKGLSQ